MINNLTNIPLMGKERKYKLNNSELIIRFGDLIESKTDVIVCSDDYDLSAVGGASKAIRKACGDVVLHDIRKKTNAELGDVVVTTAGNLQHKFLFHWTVLDLSSIALPCIGAGFAGYGFERVGRIMAEVMSDFLLKTNKSYRIEIYLYGMREDFDMMDYIAFFEQFALRVRPGNIHVPVNMIDSSHSGNRQKINKDEKYDVFISYSRLDREKADLICKYLDQFNISYWIDRESVHHGNNFKVEIIEAIQSSKILIFISSVNSNKSPNTVKEVSIAEKYGKVVIPIRIDDAAYDMSLEYDLCNRDWMNFQEDVDYDVSAKRLFENIRFYLDRDGKNK